MKKQTYIKPEIHLVVLQHQHHLLVDSLTEVESNLTPEDIITIGSGTAPGDPFWGR